MKIFSSLNDLDLISLIKGGAVGVIPTDTLYGIVASAAHPQSIERLYRLRHRDPLKACIVLVGSRDQIADKDAWRSIDWRITKRYWPGPVSIVLPTTNQTPAYLHRGEQSPPYRVPDFPELRALLGQVGPLVAPSANIEGQPPARTLQEAQDYFGDHIDFYVDAGQLDGQPSTLIKTTDNVTIIRQGAGVIDAADLA